MVAAEVADLAFYAALFVALTWSAEAGCVAPVRTEGNEAFRLTAVTAQNPSHRTAQVVIAQRMKHTAEADEGQLMSFQKRLLRGPRIGAMERCAAVHAAHGEDLQLHSLTAEIGVGFIPINLRFCRWRITLRNKTSSFVIPSAACGSSHTREPATGLLHSPDAPPANACRSSPLCAVACRVRRDRRPGCHR